MAVTIGNYLYAQVMQAQFVDLRLQGESGRRMIRLQDVRSERWEPGDLKPLRTVPFRLAVRVIELRGSPERYLPDADATGTFVEPAPPPLSGRRQLVHQGFARVLGVGCFVP